MAQRYRLVCFDLDGTLVEPNNELMYWSTLHRMLQDPREGERFENECMAKIRKGELSYKEWVDLDLGLYRKLGATRQDFIAAAKRHALVPGAKDVIRELHRRGYKLAVISGSLNILIETLFPDHPFDDVFVNEVFFDAAGKIGSWQETVYDQGTKHHALHAICEREGILLSETVFVGDGENDIDILKEAGLGIAFCPESEKVCTAGDIVIRDRNLRLVLQYLT